MCSELTPRAHVPDNRIPQLMQPCRPGQSQATQTWRIPQQLAAIASLDFRSTTATQRYVEKLSCNMKDNHCFSSSRPSTLYPGLSFHDLYSLTIVLAFSIFWAGRSIIRTLTLKLWNFCLFVQTNYFRPVISFLTPLKPQTNSMFDETNAKLHFFSEHLENWN